MRATGYTDVERGERGSTEEHLTVTQFKVQAERERLEAVTGLVAQAEQTLEDTQAAADRQKKRLAVLQKETKTAKAAALTVQDIEAMGKKNALTRNEMHVVEQSEFPVYDGQHEAIISEEDWYLAQEKRKINSFKREKVNNPDHAHILSGILRCPCCGKGMYGNIAKAHGRDKKTRYYYYCKNTITASGHECSFRLNIDQAELNHAVAKIISAMVNKPRFAEAIQAKIGTAVDTAALEQQVEVLQGRLKQTLGTKTRLERQMDTLDIGDPHYDRKISDLQRRYDEQYDIMVEIESQIDELQSQIRSIRQEKISGDNIYRLLLAFDAVYNSATEAERKELMKAFIERIDLYPEKRKDGCWIRSIVFNFPMPVEGGEVKELSLESETTVESICCLVQDFSRVLSQESGI